jgi:hypothetical protein
MSRFALFPLLYSLLLGLCPAQQLTESLLKAERDEQLLQACLGPLKRHLLELDELEKQSVKDRQYAAASRLRETRRLHELELERVTTELSRLKAQRDLRALLVTVNRIPLPLEAAKLENLQLEAGAIRSWDALGDTASWPLPPTLPPGGYEVWIRYECGALDGGILHLQEATYYLDAELETTPTGITEKKLGILKITQAKTPLKVSVKSLVKQQLMQLHEIWLVPVK